jgi:predicted ATPase/DNA-binding CsgD family transcriptional regulator
MCIYLIAVLGRKAVMSFPIASTSFIGRVEELAQICALFSDPTCRLLTLVGPGGIGKTRLAIEAAHRFMRPHDTYFVPLQPITSPGHLVSALANSLGFQFASGVDSQQQLLDYLREKAWLLVLDNFEQLLDGAPLLSALLADAPLLRLLITSRERLNLVEEWVFEVGGLTCPTHEVVTEHYSAVELFVQRARRMKANFRLTATNRAAIGHICRLVGGMPLAIQLAANWVRVLSCDAIADELQHGLDLLETSMRNVESRHRTVRAAFMPTWERLTHDERAVFMRLSVFRGGFTREAALQVAGASLPILSVLIDKSLLRVDEHGRYDVHELLQQYGEEHLNESREETARVYEMHCHYYADYLQMRVEDLKGRRQLEALAEIRAEFENVRTAWNWATEHKHLDIMQWAVEGLWLYGVLCNRELECKSLFRYAERRVADDPHPERQRLWGHLVVGAWDGTEEARQQLETALRIARNYDDFAEIAHCLRTLGSAYRWHGDYARAKLYFEQSLDLYRQLGDRYYVADVLFALMSALMITSYDGIQDDFQRYGQESLRLRREIGDRVGTTWSIAPVAHTEAAAGHFREAEHLWRERIMLGQEIGNRSLIALGYAHLSLTVYFIQGDFSKTRIAAEEALKLGTTNNFENAIGFGLVTLGLVASMDERYEEGKALCARGASSNTLVWIFGLATWGLSIAACGLGDYQAVSESFTTILTHLMNIPGLAGLIICLPIGAILLAHMGNPVRAVELLGLAFTHPVHASGWMEKWALLTRLRGELEAMLGSVAYSAAWERGKLLDSDQVAAELRQWIPTLRSSPKASSNHLLANPLSVREMEVLQLIAAGYSNQEIADRLFIGVSTVKKHINHIFDKLEVKNRTQAVAYARQRHLFT